MYLLRVSALLLILLFWPPNAAMADASPGEVNRSRPRTVKSPGGKALITRAQTGAPAVSTPRDRSRRGSGGGRGRRGRGRSKKSDVLDQRNQGLDCQCAMCQKFWSTGMSWGEVVTNMVEGIPVTEAVGDLCKDCRPVGASFPLPLAELAEKQDSEELSALVDESRARSSGALAPITDKESVNRNDKLYFQGALQASS